VQNDTPNTVDSPAADVPNNPDAPSAAVSWHEHIAPIVARRCLECHSAGGSAPFAIQSYAEAFARHRAIAASVSDRSMPPFMPGGSCQEYRDDRRLTDAEVSLVAQWSANGAPEGAVRPAPTPAPAPELEWVDRDIDIGANYTPHGVEGPLDQWWCFALDPQLSESRVLVGYEIVPTDRSLVHHAAISEASAEALAAADASNPELGWHCGATIGVGGRILGSWAAGFGAVKYPSTTGLRLNAGQRIAIQIHYRLPANGAIPQDRTHLRLQFARAPVAHETEFYGVGVAGIAIPAHTTGHMQSSDYVLDHDLVLRGVQPHMHGLGRTLRVEAVRGNERTCLLNVPRWNYHWEEMNFYRDDSIRVAAGSTISVRCTWDNPTNALVGDGLTFEDEMCDALFIATTP
jgi:hypothetical protein